jgi:hypothetical protein
VVSLLRAPASYQSQAEHSRREYEVRRQAGIKQKNYEYIPDSKHEGSEEAKLENTEISNPEKISVASNYKIPWQRKLSKTYPESKHKQDSNLSFHTQFLSGTSQRLHQPGNRLVNLDDRTYSRIRKTPFTDTDSSKVEQNRPNEHKITYKVEGNTSKWKPIRGHKITGPFKSRHGITISNPLNSEEDTLTYEVKRQDAEEEEESDHNKTVHDEDGEDGDEKYDDIKNDYARKIKETRRIHGSNTGLQSIYQQKNDRVQKIRNQVPYSARINNGARSYIRGSSSRYSENETNENERRKNIIHSRIEHLKNSIKREMTEEF